jgi:hypothetical protein
MSVVVSNDLRSGKTCWSRDLCLATAFTKEMPTDSYLSLEKSVIRSKVMPTGTAVNHKRYCKHWARRGTTSNSPSSDSAATTAGIRCHSFTVLNHPPYTPTWSSRILFSFPKLWIILEAGKKRWLFSCGSVIAIKNYIVTD